VTYNDIEEEEKGGLAAPRNVESALEDEEEDEDPMEARLRAMKKDLRKKMDVTPKKTDEDHTAYDEYKSPDVKSSKAGDFEALQKKVLISNLQPAELKASSGRQAVRGRLIEPPVPQIAAKQTCHGAAGPAAELRKDQKFKTLPEVHGQGAELAGEIGGVWREQPSETSALAVIG